MEGVWLLTLGTLFYFSLYGFSMFILKLLFKESLQYKDYTELSTRFVSTVQGLAACCAGVTVIYACSHDVLYDRHWLTNAYTWFTIPYFYYDVYSMYRSFWYNNEHLQHKPMRVVFFRLFMRDPLIMAHHILLPAIFGPVTLYLRKDLGDFFVGCFFMFEVPIPFMSVRAIMRQLKKEKSSLYLINGALLIITWILFRVLVFPFMYFVYARYKNLQVITVPFSIPVKCNCGCISIMLLQLYWLYFILRVAAKTLLKHKNNMNGKLLVKEESQVFENITNQSGVYKGKVS